MPAAPLARIAAAARALFGPATAAEGKASAAGPLISTFNVGQPVWAPRNGAALLDEGYCQNIITYFCIRLIADSVGQLKFQVFRGETELPDHPLATLLERPRPQQGRSRFIQELLIYLLATGNTWL